MTPLRRVLLCVVLAGVWAMVVLSAQVNFLNARLVTDSNGNLLVATGTTSGTAGQTPQSMANTRVKTDSSFNLLVSLGGASAQLPVLIQLGGTTSAFPALRRSGTAIEAILADASAYTGFVASSYQLKTGVGASSATITANSDKLFSLNDGANATGFELTNGTPTLGTCTGGSMTSGSHNFGGEVTGNTSGSCVINFGVPNFTNAPFCVLNDETTLTAVRISARSASSITVTGAVSADAFQFLCFGRVGT